MDEIELQPRRDLAQNPITTVLPSLRQLARSLIALTRVILRNDQTAYICSVVISTYSVFFYEHPRLSGHQQ